MGNKAEIFRNLKIGQKFLGINDKDGKITYIKTSPTFGKIVETSGKYLPHLIGGVKYFYGQNMVFIPLDSVSTN